MTQPNEDIRWMQQALALAGRGVGYVSPNPLVGCLIVQEGMQIGEGFYHTFGGPHAEVIAIQDAEQQGASIENSTVYVTLEPHSHFGKTPPCADLLIRNKIGRCVIATSDPNPQVAGRGIAMLRDAGIQVDVGILEAEAIEQNRFFFKYITTSVPYITVKLAQSLDGRAALTNGLSQWITREESRRKVHRMRSEFDAVMIGSGTAVIDDPALTVRLIEGRQPWRVVLDGTFQLEPNLQLFSDEFANKTILFTNSSKLASSHTKRKEFESLGVEVLGVKVDGHSLRLPEVINTLGTRGIASILVEPGAELAASFIREGLFDEIVCFISPRILGGDAKPSVGNLGLESLQEPKSMKLYSIQQVENSADVRIVYRAI